jgi:hypothetical protein
MHQLALHMRRACLDAAARGYDEARMSGLCQQGAFDVALDRIRSLDLDAELQSFAQDQNSRRLPSGSNT